MQLCSRLAEFHLTKYDLPRWWLALGKTYCVRQDHHDRMQMLVQRLMVSCTYLWNQPHSRLLQGLLC